MWGANLRAILNRKTWDTLRRNCYMLAGNVCEVCGETGRNGRVECHEKWEFDDTHSVQRLAGLLCLCPVCHQVKHIGRAISVAKESAVDLLRILRKLREVNGWDDGQVADHIEAAFKQFNIRSQREWTLDVSWLAANEHMMK
jgi:hypothetical protein